MRLTLRTLLAYMDDILEPADKEQLAKKIEASEFADDLMHRTRDTVRRLRLSAPQVIGSGMGLDPNTVAEYLDNVLPPESVGDFERICLESDMHLAEAAACHHVLTMVLGEPADVDPRARERMYSITQQVESRRQVRMEPAHVPVRHGESPASIGAVPLSMTSVQPPMPPMPLPTSVTQTGVFTEVPDYLRTSSWSGLRAVLAGVAALLLIGAGLFFVPGVRERLGLTMLARNSGPAVPNTGFGPVTTLQSEQSAVAAEPAPNATNTIEPPVAGTTGTGIDSLGVASLDDPTGATQDALPAAADLTSPPQPLTPGIAAPSTAAIEQADPYAAPVDEGATTDQAAGGDATAIPDPYGIPPVGDAASTTTLPAIPPATTDFPMDIAEETATAPDAAALADAGAGNVASGTLDASSVVPGTEAGTEIPVDEVPAGPLELGTYLGGETVLLRRDDEKGAWFRIAPREAVIAGDRLLALPEFRPEVTLVNGVHVGISGGTQVVVRTAADEPAEKLPAADPNVPLVEVVYGRIILLNTSNEENLVRLKLGPNFADARLAQSATLAVEVERQYVPGSDPQQSPAPVIARLYAPNGGVHWQDATGEVLIENPARWTIAEGAISGLAADSAPPDWIDQEPVGQLSEQRYGAPVVDGAITSDKPADNQLLELYHDPRNRKEVKSLVARSSIHVGLFEPFIEALRDSEQKANWRSHIDTLRAAMALSPESAANVKKALDEQRGKPAADELYEMLCGYNAVQIGRTAAEVKGGAVAQLIDRLEDDSLDYRVLAVHNLYEITGKRLMQDPASNRNERARNVKVWRARLEDGDLVPGQAK